MLPLLREGAAAAQRCDAIMSIALMRCHAADDYCRHAAYFVAFRCQQRLR